MKYRRVKVKQAVVAFIAALLLALSMVGGPALADGTGVFVPTLVPGPITNSPCWMCGGGTG